MLEAMLSSVAASADPWYSQVVYLPLGYLLAGLILSLFVPATQVVQIMVERLPGDYEVKVERKRT